MANIIGSWAVKIAADASGLIDGYRRAGAVTRDFASKAAGYAKWAGAGISNMFASFTRVDLGGYAGQFSGMAGAIASFAAATVTANPVAMALGVAAMGSAFLAYTQTGIRAVAVTTQLGREVGLTAQEAAGLQILATRIGIDGETFGDAMGKWAERLGALRAELQSGQAGPITRALEGVGINARAFTSMNLAGQFAAIAEATQRIENPMERVAALGEIIGNRLENRIGAFFRQAPDDIRNLARIASNVGINLGQDDANSIRQLNIDMKKLTEVIGGVFTSIHQGIAVRFAPIMSWITSMSTSLARDLQPAIRSVGGAIVSVIGFFSGGVMLAWVGLLLAGLRIFTPLLLGIGQMFDGVSRGFTRTWQAFQPLVSLFETLGGVIVSSLSRLFGGGGWFEVAGVIIELTVLGAGRLLTAFVDFSLRVLRDLIRTAQQIGIAFEGMAASYGIEVDFNLSSLNTTATILGELIAANEQVSNNLGNQMIAANMDMERRIRAAQAAAFGGASNQLTGFAGSMAAAMSGPAGLGALTGSSIADQISRANAEFGLTREQQEMRRAAELNLNALQIDRIRQLQLERTILEETAALTERQNQARAQIVQSNRSPYQVFLDRMQEINDMNIGGNARAGALMQAFSTLEGALPRQQERNPSAVLAGAVDGQRLLIEQQRRDQQQNRDPMERVRRVLEQANRIHMEQRDLARRMADAIDDGLIDVMRR